TFQTLPSPLPVLSDAQPLGTLPRSSLPKVNTRGLSSAAHDVATYVTTNIRIRSVRMVHSPCQGGEREWLPGSRSVLTVRRRCRSWNADKRGGGRCSRMSRGL